jgi:hypothetical protein
VTAPGPSLLIDAHVHLHGCFSPGAFLEQAAGNFERAAREHGWTPWRGALLLTESAGVDAFTGLEDGTTDTGAWTIEPADREMLVARNGARVVLLLAGRQVISAEGLEILLLGTRAAPADGRPAEEVLAEGERLGALRVIPWGAGKWLFRRGRVLDRLLEAAHPGSGFFLGDIAGRPSVWANPRHFELASRRGISVLRGTDPLPFAGQVSRPGAFGFRLAWRVNRPLSAESIKAVLRAPDAELTPYGRLERLAPFVRHQLAMQLRKRSPGA